MTEVSITGFSHTRSGPKIGSSDAVVLALIAAAGVGGALADTHATGTPVLDPLYGPVAAGFVTLVASRAKPESSYFWPPWERP